jgi:hypothetical protein
MMRVRPHVTWYIPFVVIAWGVLAATSPFVSKVLGEGVTVRSDVEFVDHVIPGTLVAVAGTLLYLVRGRGLTLTESAVAAVVFAAGFWTLATHWRLVLAASEGQQSWIGTVFMLVPGLVLCFTGAFLYGARTSVRFDDHQAAKYHEHEPGTNPGTKAASRPTMPREEAKPRSRDDQSTL